MQTEKIINIPHILNNDPKKQIQMYIFSTPITPKPNADYNPTKHLLEELECWMQVRPSHHCLTSFTLMSPSFS